MQGDDLSILLFWLALAVTFSVETVNAETLVRRCGFGTIAACCLLFGVLWQPIKEFVPHAASTMAAVATSPVSWFAIFMFLMAVLALHAPRKSARTKDAPLNQENANDLKVSLSTTYRSAGEFVKYSAAIEFYSEVRNVRICFDYRQKVASQPFNDWSRTTLLTKDFVAKSEWLYKDILIGDPDHEGRLVSINSDNDINGKKRSIRKPNWAQCVVVIFYDIGGATKESRTKFIISDPSMVGGKWPDIIPEVKLSFIGIE